MSLSVYLAGACKNLDDGGKGWREDCINKLTAIADWAGKKVKIFNPTSYFDYCDRKFKTQKQIKDYFYSRLKKCDIVLVNLNNSNYSVGTGQEIQFATDVGIPVIGFGIREVYPWIAEVDCQVVFDNVTEALDYIRDYYF